MPGLLPGRPLIEKGGMFWIRQKNNGWQLKTRRTIGVLLHPVPDG